MGRPLATGRLGPTQDAGELDWLSALERVCDQPWRIVPVFQPIVDLPRQQVCGFELLTRFDAEPRRAPDDWFAAAELLGVHGRLEARVVAAALRARDRLPPNCYLAVNISPRALLTRPVQAVLRAAGRLDRLTVELTEHSVVDDYDELGRAVAALRTAGATVAVDDAGAGYASLHHVMALRPDFVKLDRALVQGVDHDPAKQALIEAVGAFTSRLDAWLVAEGIERPGERATLRRLGVPLGQGFLLGRPAPVMEAVAPVRPWEEDGGPRPVLRLLERRPPLSVGTLPGAGARFAQDPGLAHLALVDDTGRPLGLVRREDASAVRPALVVLAGESVPVLAERAMTRGRDERFDPLVCCDERGRYLGLLPVERLVEELSRCVREEAA